MTRRIADAPRLSPNARETMGTLARRLRVCRWLVWAPGETVPIEVESLAAFCHRLGFEPWHLARRGKSRGFRARRLTPPAFGRGSNPTPTESPDDPATPWFLE